MIWLLVVPAYLLGTFPSAVMVARSKGVDITKVGSGNPGASNIARQFGTKWGVAVFVLDALKGALPALVGVLLDERPLALAMVAAAVVGHMFPATRGFKGGKGVARHRARAPRGDRDHRRPVVGGHLARPDRRTGDDPTHVEHQAAPERQRAVGISFPLTSH